MLLEEITDVSIIEDSRLECKLCLNHDNVEGWIKTVAGFSNAEGGSEADAETLAAFSKGYDRITERGLSRNPLGKSTGKRGRPAKGKVRCLVDRLIKFKDEAMRFLTDFSVPFSNNIGERSFRLSKNKMKTAGSFRSKDGGSNFFRIFSVIDTARKNGVSAFGVLSKIFSNSESLGLLGL